jgi:hypothetical protein
MKKKTRGLWYRPQIEPLEGRVVPSTDTWTGAGGVNIGWSNPANWNTLTTPAPGDDLVFPSLGSVVPTNDLVPGTILHSLSFSGGTIQGNLIALTGSLSGAGQVQLNGITLAADVSFNGNTLVYCPVDCNGFTLSLNSIYVPPQLVDNPPTSLSGIMYGPIHLGGTLAGNGNWQVLGPINVTTASSIVGCSPGAPITLLDGAHLVIANGSGGTITGNGSVEFTGIVGLSGDETYTGTTTIDNNCTLQIPIATFAGPVDVQGTLQIFGNNGPVVTALTSGPLSFSQGSRFLVGPGVAGIPLVHVNGNVDLNGTTLAAQYGTLSPPDVATILESTGTLTGTFNNLPDGASITLGGHACQIHYYNGNDFMTGEVIATSDPRSTQTFVSSSESSAGSLTPPIISAYVGNIGGTTVNGTPPPASGAVTFMEGSTPISGPIPLVNGLASITRLLTAGTHSFTAVYTPSDSTFLASTSDPFDQVINPVDMGWRDVMAGDFNGDGKQDIVGRTAIGQWWVGISDGSGSFNNQLWTTWNEAAGWQDVQVGDFNGDGKADIAGRTAWGDWWVALSDGSSFTNSFWGHWNPNVTWVDVKVGDFNGDGKTDIVGRWLQAGQWWMAQSTGSSFTNSLWGTWNPAATFVDVQAADFNGDKKTDLTARWLQGGSWWTALSTGSSFNTSMWTSWNPAATFVDVKAGDFNGDGKADITGRWLQAGYWYTAISTGTSFTTTLWASWNPSATWVDVQVGDFNGDGKADIAGRWLQGGQWWTATSTGSSFTTNRWASWNPNVTWVDSLTADFTGDGKSDLTSRYQQGGQWWTATSSGSDFATSLWTTWPV